MLRGRFQAPLSLWERVKVRASSNCITPILFILLILKILIQTMIERPLGFRYSTIAKFTLSL